MEKEIEELKVKMEEIYKIALDNKTAHQKNGKAIKENFERINKNSFALDILKDYKKEARKWFIAFVIVCILLVIVCIHHFFM